MGTDRHRNPDASDVRATGRLTRCALPGIAVQFAESGRIFQVGDEIDLEAEALPGLTWRAALGAHAQHFVEAETE